MFDRSTYAAPRSSTKPAAHAGATSRVERWTRKQNFFYPTPHPDFYGRWLWRGGSTRSHPELGSENPLRGWYCRGHPVGEYGAAGLLFDNARSDPRDQGGRLSFPRVSSSI